MPLLGNGVLAIWNDIHPEQENEFLKWHVHEHIPDRIALPGFRRARRYIALNGTPKFFNFYETDWSTDLRSEAYHQSLDNPSEWTRRVVQHFTHTSRTLCKVALTLGQGEGAVIEALRLTTQLAAADFKRQIADLLDTMPHEYGVVGAHLLEGVPQGDPPHETAEMRLRGGVDETVAWVLLVEAVRADILEGLRQQDLCDSNLVKAGADPAIQRGIYALQFSLSKFEIENGGSGNPHPFLDAPTDTTTGDKA